MNARLALLAIGLFAAAAAVAEKADRDKPMHLEANRVSIDDAKKIQIAEGDVVITKGTMVLKADRVIVTEDAYGFPKGTAFAKKGGLAYFRQKREGRDDYMEGEAERIEYNGNSETVELFRRAWVKSGEDEVRGDYIWYDSIGDKMLVTAGDNAAPNAPPPRVRAIIQPKGSGEAPPEPPAAKAGKLELKGASDIAAPEAQP